MVGAQVGLGDSDTCEVKVWATVSIHWTMRFRPNTAAENILHRESNTGGLATLSAIATAPGFFMARASMTYC
jgi:hypothetical protein